MKKIILSVFVLCLAYSVQAQSVDLGVKVGANFSDLHDAGNLNLSSKTGIVAGAFAAINFEKWGLQPELLYSKEGGKSFDLDYIKVPVLFKYYFIGNLLNVQVGPQFGFLTSDSVGEQIKTKDFDFSGAAGLGLDLPFGFRVSARYNFGFTDVTEHYGGKTGVFTIAVGYSFL